MTARRKKATSHTTLPPMSEGALKAEVLKWMGWTGFRRVHFRAARTKHGWCVPVEGDGVGWPDVVALHPEKRRIIAAELKDEVKPATAEQLAWLEWWKAVGAETYLWRPSHLPQIIQILRGEGQAS